MRVNEQPPAQNETLLEWGIYRESWLGDDMLIVDIRGDADNSPRRRRDIDELHDRIGPHDMAIDRVLIWECALRECLADDDDAVRLLTIQSVEVAAITDRKPQGCEHT